MPQEIISKFQKQYGKEKGKRVFYATANKEGRDPETFKRSKAGKKKAVDNAKKNLKKAFD